MEFTTKWQKTKKATRTTMATMAVAAAAAQPSESITYEKRYKSAMDDDPSARTLSLFSVSLIQVKHIRDRFENELVDFCKCFGINNAVRYGTV